MWEKEKMLVTCIFYFSHSVFKNPVLHSGSRVILPSYQHFLLFPQCFQKPSSSQWFKSHPAWLPAFSTFPTVFSKTLFFTVVQESSCLVTCIFYFSHSVFKNSLLHSGSRVILPGYLHFLLFPLCFQKSYSNSGSRVILPGYLHFLLFPQCFQKSSSSQ